MKTKYAFLALPLMAALLTFYGCGNKGVNPPSHASLAVSQDTLDFDSTRVQKELVIYNTGSDILTWNFTSWPAWVTLSDIQGSVYGNSNQAVAVTVDRSLLSPGANTGALPLTSNSDSLNLTLLAYKSPNPVLGELPDSLNFGAGLDSLAVTVMNTGSDTLHWTALISQSGSAFDVTPAAGSTLTQSTLWVRFDRTNLSNGIYQATLQVSSDGGNGQLPLKGYVGTAGGAWLSYTEQPTAVYPADPYDLYFAVRFDRPSGWQNYHITAIRANFYTLPSIYDDDIQFYCWGVVSNQGVLFPDIYTALHQTTLLSPLNGWNEWLVDWSLSLATFTIGYYQYDYNTLPAYPQPWYDDISPMARSYRIHQDPNTGNIYGDLQSNLDWSIEVFVEPISTAAAVPAQPQGRWIRPVKMVTQPVGPVAQWPYETRMEY